MDSDTVKIVNCIASTRIIGNFDIEKINEEYEVFVQYDPGIFPGIVIRQLEPKITFIIFYSGKISSHGARKVNIAKNQIKILVQKLHEGGYIIGSAKLDKIRIVNLVGTGDLNKKIDLEYFERNLKNIMYEPTQFPGLFYRFKDSKIVAIVFASGKVVLIGGRTEIELNKQYIKLGKIIL